MTTPVTYAVIHHSAGNTCTTKSTCISYVRGIQNLHMDTNGWGDIGYNFLVGEDGNIYEGRGWKIKGAHCPTYNSNSIGICVMGDYRTRVPNSLAQNAVKALIQCGKEKGILKSTYTLKGHRDGCSTECPGQSFYNLIRTWPNYA
jgi:peptidoglycan recognition protein